MAETPKSSPSLLTPVLDFLGRHAPFDHMGGSQLEFLAKRLEPRYFAPGEVIVAPEDGPARRFYIIKEGRVRGELAHEEGEEEAEERQAWELVAGECFPIGALLSHRPVHMVQRAVEETICYALERHDFELLLAQSAVFHDFCSRRLANLLDQALRGERARLAAGNVDGAPLSAPLGGLVRREPVTARAATPLGEALAAMEREHVGSIVAVDDVGRPVGLFTLHDLLSRVVLPGVALDRPLSAVMTAEPVTLPVQAYAHEAALLMAEHGFGHVCVVRDGRLEGVLSERDLFSLQRVGLSSLSRAIPRAADVESLVRLGRDVHRLIDRMLAQGASVAQLTEIVARLNDHLTRRVIELCLEDEEGELPEFTWLSFGSEGRSEQTLKTDQDNGILFEAAGDSEAENVRARLLPFARRVNEALARCGFPLCPGNIMASNPECCLSRAEWLARFERWIDQGTPEHLLKATIFFDYRPLYGPERPVEALREELLERTARNSRFRHQMAANALRNRPPLGMIRDFRVSRGGDHPHTFDLKVEGLAPFVDAARIYALAHGVGETNTGARLAAMVEKGVMRAADVEAWNEAYHYIQLLRMRTHQRQAGEGRPMSNHLDPDSLNELDQRILKEAFRQARKLQLKLSLEYQL
ncbi:putative nucleotidyltransferase substrate binding domain-containing protein [Endothiovibrio diazotrophicus]